MACFEIFRSLFSFVFVLKVCILQLSNISLAETNHGGFSIDLFHRDSPISPSHNPSISDSERISRSLQRSHGRANRLAFASQLIFSPKPPNMPLTDILVGDGDYLLKLSLGTPRFEILGVADTGSDLIWTQCQPCNHCYKQKSPLFSPRNSSTYQELSCTSRQCKSLPGTSCIPGSKKLCQYAVGYGDNSFSRGVLATDMVTLGSANGQPMSLPKTVFGCGYNNGGTFKEDADGIIGLGGGAVSLISQMGSSINGKFSYCLVPNSTNSTKSSKMNFGSRGVVSGNGVLSTSLLGSSKTSYTVKLEGVSVGDKRLAMKYYSHKLSSSSSNSSGISIMLDSGTTLTYLPLNLYACLESAVKNAIKLQPQSDPRMVLKLCYVTPVDSIFPSITLHFSRADVKLNPINTFVAVGANFRCLAFVPQSNLAILGNLAQMNLLVGYDLKKKTVSFKPTDCTKY